MAKPDPNVVGIDIGSSKVGVLIAQRREDGELEVVGKGRAPNRGTRRGNVVNVEATVDALKAACEEAEVMAGLEISRAYVGIAGADIRSVNSRGMVSVARRDREITHQDIQRVLEAAQSAALPNDREILHAIPQEFLVDEQGGIADPIGMLGSRLEVGVHLVTGQATRSCTMLTCLNRAGIEVVELVFEALATAEAVLTHDERELGVLLVDIGTGTTGYAWFEDGEVHHSAVLPVGAGHFTSDIATVLRTPFSEAERIKVQKGCCLASMVGEEEGVSVPAVAGGATRVVPKRELCEILQPRGEELFQMVQQDLARAGLGEPPRGGVVITGGGAQLDGLLELAEQTFTCSVRYGLPRGLGGLVDVINCPTWCTASGLILYGLGAERRRDRDGRRQSLSVRQVMGSIKNMFADLL
ncbi:MAG TPA: cell division protein FtsA [Thermoanaerobaculia bacterium]|nr:cell division protein FtsA [Thermoanaerobaculia bacterium]